MPNDDDRIFRKAMAGVKPLQPARPVPAAPKPRASARFSRSTRTAPLWEEARHPHDSGAAEGGDTVSWRRPSVREDTLRQLRRGRIAVEGEIDLHGLTRHAAHESLRVFLGMALAQRLRCIRIIHGKGLRSGTAGPILKHSVIDWLGRLEQVLAFTSARPADGGTGALYVLLKLPPGPAPRGAS